MIRITRPTRGNKYYNTISNGGYSTCIKGKPTDSQCDVLSNCVGYSNGAFNEELNLGYEKYHLNCNAENFVERAIASGLSVVSKPVKGGVMVWEGLGNLAGHVAIATEVINSNSVRMSESNYGSSIPFSDVIRTNNNGRWGLNANFRFRGCIINPNYPDKPTPVKPTEKIPYKRGMYGSTIEKIDEWLYSKFKGNICYRDIDFSKLRGNYFGNTTYATVKRFQERAKIDGVYKDVADGIIGLKTLEAMRKYGYKG